MPVVAHDAVTAKPHIYACKALCEDPFKGEEVGGLLEDACSHVGTVDDVVNNAAC